MENKILFICKKRIDGYGKSFGLLNSANFISNFFNDHNIQSKVVTVIDSNSIDKEATEYNASHVFIEALFVSPEKMREILSIPRHFKRKWIVRIHSRIPFLANEGNAIKLISGYSKLQECFNNLFIAPNDYETAMDFKKLFRDKWFYLPNIYKATEYSFKETKKNNNHILNIGCFGAIRPMKNNLIQAVAAIEYAKISKKILKFHINADRIEQNGDPVLKNIRELFKNVKGNENFLRFELVEHPWLCHRDFIELVRKMDIGLQVSLSESFNIVAADFVSNGIPVVTSPEVRWMNFLYKADANSSESIVNTLDFAMSVKHTGFHNINKINLSVNNYFASIKWLSFIFS